LRVISEFTGKEYETDDTIPYGNATQSAQYWNWGVRPVDMYATDENRFIFVFNKEDHKKLIGRWNAQKQSK
jgi:hypothetical protein